MLRILWRSAAVIIALGLAGFAPGIASADVYVSPTGTDAGTCTSGSPCLTLDYAVSQASDPDTVNIAAGTYTGASNRAISFSKELTFQGAGQATTIIDAEEEDFILRSEAGPIWVNDITFKDADFREPGQGAAVMAFDPVGTQYFNVYAENITADSNNASYIGAALLGLDVEVTGTSSFTGNTADYGGAIYATGNVTIDPGDGQTATFTDNYAGTDGGAVYAEETASVDGSTFTGDPIPGESSAGDDGGAVYVDDDTPAEFDLIVTNSTFSDFLIDGYYGGALSAYDGGASLNNVTIEDSFSGEYGGGLYSDTDATIIDSTFERNDTDCCEGGGAYVNGMATVEDSTFRNNKADGGGDDGAGFYASDGADVSGSEFTGNEGSSGAGAYIDAGSSDTLIITDSTFRNNSVSSYGGGLYLGGSGLGRIEDSTFEDNTAGGTGGGVEMNSGTISGSTFSGNESGDDGAAVFFSYGDENVVENSTFTGNSGPGVIFTDNSEDPAITLELNNVTVAGNTLTDPAYAAVETGSGATADLEVSNSIIAQDDGSGGDAKGCEANGTITSGGGNVIQDTTTGCDALVGGPPAPTARVSEAQIGLQALALNAPGTTETMAIGADSVAANAGVPGECLATDQRGVSRPADSCSSGAYQYTVPAANPRLRVWVNTPDRTLAGRTFKVTVKTKNRATSSSTRAGALRAGITAEDVKTCAKLPNGVFVVRKNGGRVSGRTICWTRSSLPAGSSVTYQAVVRSSKTRSGSTRVTGTASASNGEGATVRAKASSRVKVVKPRQPKPKPPTG